MLEYGGKEKGNEMGSLFQGFNICEIFESPPEVLIIHCGGNSLGYVPLHTLRRHIFYAILEMRFVLPKTKSVVTNVVT